jgi:Putative Flp pilus-assembly TadE/G-like
MHPALHHRTRAQALIWLTVAVPLFVSLAGLVIDGGVLLDERRELQSIVDGAARSGATQLDRSRLRASGGADVQLDPVLATQTARAYADQALASNHEPWSTAPRMQVEVEGRRVHVLIQAQLPTAFLRIVAINSVPVQAESFGDVQYGIHDGGGR